MLVREKGVAKGTLECEAPYRASLTVHMKLPLNAEVAA
jgi:hypothetical protein